MIETDRLAEIKARWAAWDFRPGSGGSSLSVNDLLWSLQQDQRWLVAEVERLRQELVNTYTYLCPECHREHLAGKLTYALRADKVRLWGGGGQCAHCGSVNTSEGGG